MTREQNATIILELHKIRIEQSTTFEEFKRHQIEFLKFLIADNKTNADLDKALEAFCSYDD